MSHLVIVQVPKTQNQKLKIQNSKSQTENQRVKTQKSFKIMVSGSAQVQDVASFQNVAAGIYKRIKQKRDLQNYRAKKEAKEEGK
jgi:hypothetical protein